MSARIPNSFSHRTASRGISWMHAHRLSTSPGRWLSLGAHDLRRTFVSVGVTACDIDLHKIELLTNHVPKGITAKHYLQLSGFSICSPRCRRLRTM